MKVKINKLGLLRCYNYQGPDDIDLPEGCIHVTTGRVEFGDFCLDFDYLDVKFIGFLEATSVDIGWDVENFWCVARNPLGVHGTIWSME